MRPRRIAANRNRRRRFRHSRVQGLGGARARGGLGAARRVRFQALDALQAALCEVRTQQCRYETAEVYELMALAHEALGDADLAAAHAATAQSIYSQLGVETPRTSARPAQGGLTKREIEILTRIASGATNKQVADQIFIGEKTVGRHLANIYTKLGVSSRTAAVTSAYANNVLRFGLNSSQRLHHSHHVADREDTSFAR